MLSAVVDAMRRGEVKDELDRFSLIQDVSALAKAGICSTTQVLELLLGYQSEKSQCVWDTIYGTCQELCRILHGESEYTLFQKMLRELLLEIKQDLGWEEKADESPEQKILRHDILTLCDQAGFKDVASEGTKRFWEYWKNDVKIPSGLRRVIFKIAVKHGGKEEYQILKKRYIESEDSAERTDLIVGMTSSKNSEIHSDLLEFVVSDHVRLQDKSTPLSYLGANFEAVDQTWAFVKDNWSDLYTMFGGGFLTTRLAKVPYYMNTIEKADEVKAFYDTVRESSPAANRAMDQTVEGIKSRGQWKKRDIPDVKKWLQTRSGV